MTSHLDEGILHQLLDGEIPSSELSPIQAHLAECGECRARLEEAAAFLSESDRLIEELDRPEATAPQRPASAVAVAPAHWKRNLAWAATVVIAVGAGYYARGGPIAAPPSQTASVKEAFQEAAAPPTDSPIAATLQDPAPRQSVLADQAAPPPDAAPAGKAADREKKGLATELRGAEQLAGRAEPDSAARPPAQPVAPLTPAAEVPPPTAPLTTLPGERARMDLRSSVARRTVGRLNEAVVPAGAATPAAMTAELSAAPETIQFPEAIRRLNGTLRLIDGLVPDRFEAIGQEVRVVYALANGELHLSQRLVNGRNNFRLTAPAGFPADSLLRLQARIRE